VARAPLHAPSTSTMQNSSPHLLHQVLDPSRALRQSAVGRNGRTVVPQCSPAAATWRPALACTAAPAGHFPRPPGSGMSHRNAHQHEHVARDAGRERTRENLLNGRVSVSCTASRSVMTPRGWLRIRHDCAVFRVRQADSATRSVLLSQQHRVQGVTDGASALQLAAYDSWRAYSSSRSLMGPALPGSGGLQPRQVTAAA